MVRLGMTKRSPSEKSSNQRCSGTMRCAAGSNSVIADVLRKRLIAYRYRRGITAAIERRNNYLRRPGLDPGPIPRDLSIKQRCQYFPHNQRRWLRVPAQGRDDDLLFNTQRVCRVELFQFFSDAQTPRERRKRSTGVDDPSASKRCSSTPLHWKPHFSRMLRDDGLATRAPEINCSTSNSSKVKSTAPRAVSVPNPGPQCSTPSQ